MYIALIGCAQQGASQPLAASVIADGSAPLEDARDHITGAGGSPVTFGQGGIQTVDISVSATGGSGSYTFSWGNSELRDDFNAFTVANVGTTNAARYNTFQVTGTIPASASDPPNSAIYTLTCTVSDGSSSVQVPVDVTFTTIGI
tara:strand:- start:209 stop:643 length:435 start_codon:yes stop_codon:yes gene_type:complete